MNHCCADSGSKRITAVQTLAPNKSLLRRLCLQTNHCCADSGSKWITTVQTLAPNESLLCRLWLQINHCCADSGSKLITAVQTLAPNESLLCRLWLQMNHCCAVSVTVPGPILTVSCVCACVWAGVCGCVWLRLIHSSWESLPWAISDPVTLSPLSDPCSVCRVRVGVFRSVPVPGSAIPKPCCFPGLRTPETRLPIASLRYPPLPTESSTVVFSHCLLL